MVLITFSACVLLYSLVVVLTATFCAFSAGEKRNDDDNDDEDKDNDDVMMVMIRRE